MAPAQKGPSNEDQRVWLEDAMSTVKQNAVRLRRAIEQDNYQEVIKFATLVLNELRTSMLSPKRYYQLYSAVFTELNYVEQYFEEYCLTHSIQDVYDHVQQCGNIIPRIYLLITAGVVFLRRADSPAADIMKDLVQMAKGIQHPVRGLFVRHYLNQATKNAWKPDASEMQGTVEIVLSNFAEMTRLWTRLATAPAYTMSRHRAEEERTSLEELVGHNLVRLVNLDGMDALAYRKYAIPAITRHVLSCHDRMVQSYLLDTIVQGVPDEFHAQTLPYLVSIFRAVLDTVPVVPVMVSLVDRLASFMNSRADDPGMLESLVELSEETLAVNQLGGDFEDIDTNDIIPVPAAPEPTDDEPQACFLLRLAGMLETVIEQRPTLGAEDALRVHLALLKATLSVMPDRIDMICPAFSRCRADVTAIHGAHPLLEQVLTAPIMHIGSVLNLASIEGYDSVLAVASPQVKLAVATMTCERVVADAQPLSRPAEVQRVLTMALPLLSGADDEDEVSEHCGYVAGIVTLIDNPDPAVAIELLDITRSFIQKGDLDHVKVALQPLMHKALDIALSAGLGGVTTDPLFRFATEIIHLMAELDVDTALHLQILAALTSDKVGLDDVTFDFVGLAITTVQDKISGSRLQFEGLLECVSAITTLTAMSPENYETIATNLTHFASRFITRQDQCRAVAACASLWWNGVLRKGDRVLECIKRSLTAADKCKTSMVSEQYYYPLILEMIDHTMFFIDRGCPEVTPELLSGLMAVADAGLSESTETHSQHYAAIKTHVSAKVDAGVEAYCAVVSHE
ncbi:Vacuolar Protein Sorting 35 (VPS35) [Carpediemonas membranifera]|uniref:Vacuolar protein sorting-associated protein 35 n=1 Tax=Carpediemonas membranifera TaxID=201153 RepID=A0A8J6E6M6_9EUKA|nr:Vacuolar Protein Sorting 35 (VPS35) [Carpediemonas membranifera]|eukprot:KAG9389725.1 Vacuolar Protein Sorting 35 (VPS35) [Carpediemonas membranifera]